MEGSPGFRFGDFEACLARGELRRRGFRVRLQDLPFRLLCALVEQEGALVTREELVRRLWPGESYGDFAHRLGAALNRLREALGDPATQSRFVETIPRRGYRFRATIEWLPAPVTVAITPVRRRSRWLRGGLATALLVCASIGVWREPAAVEGQEPAGIALLPFSDLTGRDEPLCDGLTRETVARLSRVSSMAVLGRATSAAGEEDRRRAGVLARELGVPFVLEGSVRRGPASVLVSVRLVSVRSQSPVWSDSYEGGAGEVPALQARVAGAVAEAVRAHAVVR